MTTMTTWDLTDHIAELGRVYEWQADQQRILRAPLSELENKIEDLERDSTRVGTSHFRSFFEAVDYYKPYGTDRHGVEMKLANGEIHLGPPTGNGEWDKEGRWWRTSSHLLPDMYTQRLKWQQEHEARWAQWVRSGELSRYFTRIMRAEHQAMTFGSLASLDRTLRTNAHVPWKEPMAYGTRGQLVTNTEVFEREAAKPANAHVLTFRGFGWPATDWLVAKLRMFGHSTDIHWGVQDAPPIYVVLRRAERPGDVDRYRVVHKVQDIRLLVGGGVAYMQEIPRVPK